MSKLKYLIDQKNKFFVIMIFIEISQRVNLGIRDVFHSLISKYSALDKITSLLIKSFKISLDKNSRCLLLSRGAKNKFGDSFAASYSKDNRNSVSSCGWITWIKGWATSASVRETKLSVWVNFSCGVHSPWQNSLIDSHTTQSAHRWNKQLHEVNGSKLWCSVELVKNSSEFI